MKPTMNPALAQWGIGLLGGVLVAIAHIQGPITWQSVLTVIGAAIGGGQLFQRAGDIPLKALPVEVQESVRPKPPSST